MKRSAARLASVLILVIALAASVTPAVANQKGRLSLIGVLATSADIRTTEAFREGLQHLGYVEGGNVIVEYRFNEGRVDRLPGLASELIGLNPDVIVAVGAVHAQALKAATTRIPIVFAINPDAVEVGLVEDNARPGANLTGFTAVDPDEYVKQLALLKEMLPGLTRVAFFADLDIAESVRGGEFPIGQKEAGAVGLELQGVGLRASGLDLDAAFAGAKSANAEALLVLQQPVTGLNRQAIAERALTERLPALFWADAADDVWLATYGSSLAAAAFRTSSYVDRILKGEQAGELPVISAASETLTINLITARQLGLAIPAEVLVRADRVIGS